MPIYTTTASKSIITAGELGRGGEGIIYTISGVSGQVAKIYHLAQRTSEKEQKLRAMIANPPRDDTRLMSPPHVSIAWPLDLLYEQQRFAGYLMPRIQQSPDIFKVYNPKLRAKSYPGFDWRYLHRSAKNLAIALNALHARGYIMGDVNQKNILVTTQALVTLVDTDSFQVPGLNGQIYRCQVGVPEYVPPELQGKPLSSVDRATHHDAFGLAVITFQLLMEGYHPFTGAPKDPSRSLFEETYLHCIKQGIFPYRPNNQFNPPPGAPPLNALHPEIQQLYLRCFVAGHHNPTARPTTYEWLDALDKAESALIQCRQNPTHWYSRHANRCHWCERNLPRQQPLPPISPPPPRPPKPKPPVKPPLTKPYAPVYKPSQVQRPVYTPPRPVYTPPPPATVMVSNKSPIVATLLSLFLMGGAGQIYLGQKEKAIALIVAMLVTFPFGLGIFVLLAGTIDAYSTAKKMNQGIAVGEWEFSFSGEAVIVVGLIFGIIIVGILVTT